MKKRYNFLLLTLSLFLLSCSSKVTQENYDKISIGMPVSQVESILGKGESGSEVDIGLFMMTWESGEKVIAITFINGKVNSKNQHGRWD